MRLITMFSYISIQKRIRSQRGQVLVETMVALSMTVIGLLGILSVMSNAIAINRVIVNQYIASYLASEGIEVISYFIDKGTYQGKNFGEDFGTGARTFFYPSSNESFPFDDITNQVTASPTPEKIYVSSTTLLSDGVGYGAVGDQTPFHRVIVVESSGGDVIKVGSMVVWQGRGGQLWDVTVEDYFYNWRKPVVF